MKKVAYILLDDLLHSKKRILPLLGRYFNYENWHVCVMKNWNDICILSGAPDLIVNFKDSRDNWRLNTSNWYEGHFSNRIADYVTQNGCGYLAIHAGLLNIPEDHPIKTKVLHGGIDVETGAPVFTSNLFFGKIKGLPFGLYSDVTFTPQGVHPVLAGVDAFTIRDEQCKVTLSEQESEKVQVLGYLESGEAGKSIGAWAAESGEGRAVGIAMGHLTGALTNSDMVRLIQNAINWCGKIMD